MKELILEIVSHLNAIRELMKETGCAYNAGIFREGYGHIALDDGCIERVAACMGASTFKTTDVSTGFVVGDVEIYSMNRKDENNGEV